MGGVPTSVVGIWIRVALIVTNGVQVGELFHVYKREVGLCSSILILLFMLQMSIDRWDGLL